MHGDTSMGMTFFVCFIITLFTWGESTHTVKVRLNAEMFFCCCFLITPGKMQIGLDQNKQTGLLNSTVSLLNLQENTFAFQQISKNCGMSKAH